MFPSPLTRGKMCRSDGRWCVMSVWADVIVMVGTPIVMVLVAWGVHRLTSRKDRDKDRP